MHGLTATLETLLPVTMNGATYRYHSLKHLEHLLSSSFPLEHCYSADIVQTHKFN